MLLCPVRNCRLPLVREERRVVCSQGHSFDVARSGYINLLQPQERRSKQPGDTPEAVAARRRLHDLGVTRALFRGIADSVRAVADEQILDCGCGEGFYPGNLALETGCKGHGIDISIPAIDAAARRYGGCEWIVGNADRFIPYSDGSFDAALSITGRMNVAELRRVLRPEGRLLIAVAAPDDLIELRGTGRDRVPRTVEEFSMAFRLADQRRVTTHADLDAAGIADILHSIYRPLQPVAAEARRVTFSLDLLTFVRTG